MPAPHPHLEIDLAVARGDTYLHRARFRPSTILTVGSNPMTTVQLQGDDLPEFHELLRLTDDGVLLRFTPDVKVEVLAAPGQVMSTEQLIQRGVARPSGEGYALPLEMNGKAVVRLGPYKLMFRVEGATENAVRAVKLKQGDEPRCPSCGRDQPLAVAAGGAISVCDACGAWTQYARPGGSQGAIEDGSTQIGVSPNLRIGAHAGGQGAAAANADILGADLPTFDAIQAFKDDEGLRTMDAVQALKGSAPAPPPARGGKSKAPVSIGPVPQPRTSSPSLPRQTAASASGQRPAAAPQPDHAADLPTFDAIQAIKEDGMSTMDAVQALKVGGAEPQAKREEQAARRPVNLADMVRPAEPAPGPNQAGGKKSMTTPRHEPRITAPSPPPQPPPRALESGHWEETLTIHAVKPKKAVKTVYIAVAALGIGMALAFVAVLVLRRFGMLDF